MNREKIIIATWFYDEQPGFLDFRYRIESLSQHYDVTLVIRAEHFKKEFDGIPVRIEVISTEVTGKLPLFGFMYRLATYVKKTSPDLVVLLGSQLALCTFLLNRVPCILYWNEHPTHFFGGGSRPPVWLRKLWGNILVALSYLAVQRAACVMPIGGALRDDLYAHGIKPSRIQLIYMGVANDFQRLKQRNGIPTDQPICCIYTGSVMKERGRDVMLEGLALARQSGVDCRLIIVGADDDQLKYCIARVGDLGISKYTEVIGRVPGNKIPDYLRHADYGICIWEDRVWWRFNPPTKLFEYLVAGLPVFASNIRTHTEYVRDNYNGFVFEYDANDFSNALIKAYQLKSNWSILSENASADAQRFLWPRIEPLFLATVQKVLEYAENG